MRILFVAAVCALVLSCTRSDALYCDENTPCTDPERPFCDLNGAFPASAGVGRTCIAEPGEDVVDGGIDPPPDAIPMCSMSSECPASSPICEGNRCEACILGGQGDSSCAARDPSLPVCTVGGTCQECNRNSDCGDANAPFCDQTSNTCEPCSEHEQCASGACALELGSCVDEADIIYADISGGIDGPFCGMGTGIAACQHLGSALGALNKVTATRKIIVMAQGNYIEAVAISGLDVDIIGHGSRLFPMSFLISPALSIVNGAQVFITGLSIEGGNSFSEGAGIRCTGSDLALDQVVLRDNDDAGLRADDCFVEILDSEIVENGHQGIRLSNGTALSLQDSRVESNAFQGLLADDSVLEIRRTSIFRNISGGLRINETSFLLENNVIAQNGNVNANPAQPAGGIVVSNSASTSPQIIRHNTITGNQAPGLVESAGIVCAANAVVTVVSSIVVANERPGSDPQFTSNCSVSYSNVTDIDSGTGNISVAPTFVSAPTGDYHLAFGSAGIDLASPSSPTATDIDGDPRPSGSGYEMGADERP